MENERIQELEAALTRIFDLSIYGFRNCAWRKFSEIIEICKTSLPPEEAE